MSNIRTGLVSTHEISVDLEKLSDGDLLELAVPSESPTQSRRVLVIWLYLNDSPKTGLEEFDRSLTDLAEKELQRRANPNKK